MFAALGRLLTHADLARRAVAVRFASNESARAAARQHLAARLGKMRGIPQKLGQIVSLGEDASDGPFAALREAAEPLPWETIAGELERAWHRPWRDVIRTCDPAGRAASLGQVHEAVLHDGRRVAIKVQYPGMRECLETDLSLLGWLSAPVGNLRRGFDMAGYREVIRAELLRELDYRAEAQAQRDFQRFAANARDVVIPQVVDALSTDTVLVSDWEAGETWDDVQGQWSETERRRLANALVKFSLEGLLVRGAMHADLHPGNIRFRRADGGVQFVLYDFGSVFYATWSQRAALIRLIQAAMTQAENPWPLWLALGFDRDLLAPLAAKLPALTQVLFEPFAAEASYDLRQWRLRERLGDILGADRWNFRIAGPPQLALLLRAFHGLKFYLEGLATSALWGPVWGEIWKREGDAAQRLQLPVAARPEAEFSTLAKWLKVRISSATETKVEFTAPARTIDDLDALLDSELIARIEAQGQRLEAIVTQVRQRGYAPGPVFTCDAQGRQVRVWLD